MTFENSMASDRANSIREINLVFLNTTQLVLRTHNRRARYPAPSHLRTEF